MSLNKDLSKKYSSYTTGIKNIIPSGTTKGTRYVLLESMWFSALKVILKNHNVGDAMSLRIIAPDGVTVARELGKDIPVDDSICNQGKEEVGYWAEIPKNFILEIGYISAGTVDVDLRVNLYLHKNKL